MVKELELNGFVGVIVEMRSLFWARQLQEEIPLAVVAIERKRIVVQIIIFGKTTATLNWVEEAMFLSDKSVILIATSMVMY